MKRSVYIRTLGCPKNETDSEHLRGTLEASGYAMADDADQADVVVVNTCSFIDAARKESVDAILDQLAARQTGQKVIVAGCLVERYGEQLAAELPEVDGFMSLGALRTGAGHRRLGRARGASAVLRLGEGAARTGGSSAADLADGVREDLRRAATACARSARSR